MNEENVKDIATEPATEILHFVESVILELSPIVLIPATFMISVVLIISFAAIIRRRRDAEAIRAAFSLHQDRTDQSDLAPAPPRTESGATVAQGERVETPPPLPAAEELEVVAAVKSSDNRDWITRLRLGLTKTRSQISSKIAEILQSPHKLDTETLEAIHETLYRADIGVKAADRLVATLKQKLSGSSSVTKEDVMDNLRQEIAAILKENAAPSLDFSKPPRVILVVGVNGVGKTTTIGKLAAHFMAQGRTVLFGASDTFRAAAIAQLNEWGKRLQVEVIAHQQDSDPAAVAFDAAKAAKARSVDCLIVDTAGRLHNKEDLMQELAKIKKVLGREIEAAPHEVWLVLDATTGQNAISQAKAFKSVVDVTGIVVTKLDGTAKGGVVVGISMDQGLPIRYIGVGEGAEDLRAFDPDDFAESIFNSNL